MESTKEKDFMDEIYFRIASDKKEINIDIIDYIKQARLKKGITQKQLAEMAGVSKSLIGTAESYQQKYSKSTVKKLFNILALEPIREKELIKNNYDYYIVSQRKMLAVEMDFLRSLHKQIEDKIISLQGKSTILLKKLEENKK
ncbi:MAG: helix-turn-helix domain-containing protein [bacterium]